MELRELEELLEELRELRDSFFAKDYDLVAYKLGCLNTTLESLLEVYKLGI